MTPTNQDNNKRSLDMNNDLSKGMSPVRKATNRDRSMDCADNVTVEPRTEEHNAKEHNQPEDKDMEEETEVLDPPVTKKTVASARTTRLATRQQLEKQLAHKKTNNKEGSDKITKKSKKTAKKTNTNTRQITHTTVSDNHTRLTTKILQ